MNSAFLQRHWTFSVAVLSARYHLRSMTCRASQMLLAISPRKTLSGELFLLVHQTLLSLYKQLPSHWCSTPRPRIS
jgi:hypothetical protein